MRSRNPRVIVVAGGHGVRALPRYSQPLFDYACLGDVEEIREVIREALGPDYVAREFTPRYDLAYWMKRIGYVESSRNCNFRCSFCSLTGVGLPYRVSSMDALEAQLEGVGRRRVLFFNDNQLLGDGQRTFRSRIERVDERRQKGQFDYWGGFVTDTFFWDESNIRLAHETGCVSLFVGVEYEHLEGRDHRQTSCRHSTEFSPSGAIVSTFFGTSPSSPRPRFSAPTSSVARGGFTWTSDAPSRKAATASSKFCSGSNATADSPPLALKSLSATKPEGPADIRVEITASSGTDWSRDFFAAS